MGELETEEGYTCPCGKHFRRKAPYQRHMDVVHSSTESYKCKVCSKTFGNQNTLTMHMSVHAVKQQPFNNNSTKGETSISNSKVPKTSTTNSNSNSTSSGRRTRSGSRGRSGERKERSSERLAAKGTGTSGSAGATTRAAAATAAAAAAAAAVTSNQSQDLEDSVTGTASSTQVQDMGTASSRNTDQRANSSADPVSAPRQCNSVEDQGGSQVGSEARPNCIPATEGVSGHANCQPATKGGAAVDANTAATTEAAPATAVAATVVVTSSASTDGQATASAQGVCSKGLAPSLPSLQQQQQQQQQLQQQQQASNQPPRMVSERTVVSTETALPHKQQQQEQGKQQAQQQQPPLLVKASASLSGIKQGLGTFVYPTTIGELENGETSDVENAFTDGGLLSDDSDEKSNVRKSDRLRGKVPGWKTILEEGDWSQESMKNNAGRKRRLTRIKAEESDLDDVEGENTPEAIFDGMTADLDLAEDDGLLHLSAAKKSRPNKTDLFTCRVCGKSFFSEKYLSMHSALHGASYPTENLLSDTFKEQEPELPKRANGMNGGPISGSNASSWTCKICNKTFAQNSNFKNHMRTHSDERPFVCDICCIGFKERYHLKKHQLFKHSTELREKCRVCGKRFKDSTAVRAHERIHSDVRPYSCRRCGKAFKTSECLWHHENRSKTCGQVVGAPLPPLQRAKRGRPATKKDKATATTVATTSTTGIRQIANTTAGVTTAAPLPVLKVEPVMKVEPLLPCQSENVILKYPVQNKKVLVKKEPIDIDADLEALANDILPDIEATIAASQITDNIPFKALNPDMGYLSTVLGLPLGQPLAKPVQQVHSEAELPVVVQHALKQEVEETSPACEMEMGPKSRITAPFQVTAVNSPGQGDPCRSPSASGPDTTLPATSCGQNMKLPTVVEAANQANMAMSANSKKYECGKCGRGFTSAIAFDRHGLVHSEVRPYRCDVCDLGFKLKVHLKKHNLYRHSDEYPCECHICGKKFKDSSAVRLHERIHSDHRPFSCSCGKTFKTKENLWGHQHRGPCESLRVGLDDAPTTSVAGNSNATAVVGNGQVTAQATIRDNEIIAQAILDNNKVLAKATIGDNGEVTASATVTNSCGSAHATFNTGECTAQATVSGAKTFTTMAKDQRTYPAPVLTTPASTGAVVAATTLAASAALKSSPTVSKSTSLLYNYTEEKRQTIQFVDVTPAPIIHAKPVKSLSTAINTSSLPPFETFAPIGRSPVSSPVPAVAAPPVEKSKPKPEPAKRPLSIAERCPTIQKCLMQKGPQPFKLPGIQHLLQSKMTTSTTTTTYQSVQQVQQSGISSPLSNTGSTVQQFITNDNPMLSSREPFLRTPPPYKPPRDASPYSTADYSPMVVNSSQYSPYQATRPASVSSDFSESRGAGGSDGGLPIIYWADDEADRKSESCNAWPTDSDTLFQEISASGLL